MLLRRILCRHNFHIFAAHNFSQQNIWVCRKCLQSYLQHYGMGTGHVMKKKDFNALIIKDWSFAHEGDRETSAAPGPNACGGIGDKS